MHLTRVKGSKELPVITIITYLHEYFERFDIILQKNQNEKNSLLIN